MMLKYFNFVILHQLVVENLKCCFVQTRAAKENNIFSMSSLCNIFNYSKKSTGKQLTDSDYARNVSGMSQSSTHLKI